MNDRNILPLSDNAPVSYDLRMAVPIMAALSHREIRKNVWEWLYVFYTQIVCKTKITPKTSYKRFHIYDPYNPFIKRRFELHISNKWKNKNAILEYVINNIDNGYYVHLKMDRFYMPGFMGYNNQHTMHTECVYGYDVKKQEIYVIGFPEFANSKLKKMKLSFDNFVDAFSSFALFNTLHTITKDKVKKNTSYCFKPALLKKQLKRYLKSKCPTTYLLSTNIQKQTVFAWDFPVNSCFGIKTISFLVELLKLEHMEKNSEYPLRIMFHALYEFTQLMSLRLLYLSENSYIEDGAAEEYQKHCKEYLLIRNLYIKYEITNNKDILVRIINRLERCIVKETELIQKTIKDLSSKKKRI